MYKKILISSFFLATCALSYAQAPATASTDANAAEMSFNTKDHDFGTIEQDGNGTYMFLFTNTGKEPLVIKEAHGSCGCTVPKWPHDPVAPGQQDTIKVTMIHTTIPVFFKKQSP